jgi:5'-phosphate synthase pdxT subunit
MKIGVLALQGDFEAHSKRLAQLGAEPVPMRYASQLREVDGLILPGGESSTNIILLEREGLWDELLDFSRKKPVLGTCAGAILLASQVSNPSQRSLAAMEMSIERNAYGRQIDSSIRTIEPEPEFVERTCGGPLEAVFIRAPIIRSIGPQVRALLRDRDQPILVEQGLHLAATFHSELTPDTRLHELFLDKVRSA